ncbi:two component transcriptional regulator, LytTR family [Eubacterium ruminantium]|nr:two component transcriptional regulator, LytTR family [Eubacterium ruminantium]
MKELFSINIAVCDDDILSHRDVFSFCDAYFSDKNVTYNLYSYYSGEDILSEREKRIDLLFLDIEMDGVDGIEVMKQIEEIPSFHRIIFISSHTEMMKCAFGYKTIGFLGKPIDQKEIFKKLDGLYKKIVDDSVVRFSETGKELLYRRSDIIYIEADSNYINIYSEEGVKTIACTLKTCEEMINGLPFLRIHKSYIVNLDYVKDIRTDSVYLKNGIKIAIGRSYRDLIRTEYQRYLIKELY